MRVELLDAAPAQHAGQRRRHALRNRSPVGCPRRGPPDGGNGRILAASKLLELRQGSFQEVVRAREFLKLGTRLGKRQRQVHCLLLFFASVSVSLFRAGSKESVFALSLGGWSSRP